MDEPAPSVIEGSSTAPTERTRRESKKVTMDENFITDEKELRRVSQAKPDLRKMKSKKRSVRPESTEPKPKKKTAAEELEIRYKADAAAQNEVDNKFIAKTLALRPVESTINIPSSAYTCKSVHQAIIRSFQEAGVSSMRMVLKERSCRDHNIGSLCQVFWEVWNQNEEGIKATHLSRRETTLGITVGYSTTLPRRRNILSSTSRTQMSSG